VLVRDPATAMYDSVLVRDPATAMYDSVLVRDPATAMYGSVLVRDPATAMYGSVLVRDPATANYHRVDGRTRPPYVVLRRALRNHALVRHGPVQDTEGTLQTYKPASTGRAAHPTEESI
jgi:hypothetical protein